MNSISIGRRSFVRKLSLAAAAAAIPALPALAAPAEDAMTRVDRLMGELTDAMAAAAKGGNPVAQTFRVVIDSDGMCFFESRAQAREVYNLANFINGNDHAALAEYHSFRLGSALAMSRGGRWVGTEVVPRGSSAYGVLMFIQHPSKEPASFTQVYA